MHRWRIKNNGTGRHNKGKEQGIKRERYQKGKNLGEKRGKHAQIGKNNTVSCLIYNDWKKISRCITKLQIYKLWGNI